MARNRKVQSAEVRFGPALKALLFCLLLGGTAVGYVFQKEQVNALKKQERELDARLAHLRLSNAKMHQELARRESPVALEQAVRRHRLDLGLPHPSQVVLLPSSNAAARDGGPVLPAQIAEARLRR
jgi:hypothetical protein